jgi:hypothetical protein
LEQDEQYHPNDGPNRDVFVKIVQKKAPIRGSYRKTPQEKLPEKSPKKFTGYWNAGSVSIREYPASQMTALVHVRNGGAIAGLQREEIPAVEHLMRPRTSLCEGCETPCGNTTPPCRATPCTENRCDTPFMDEL